jgi:hypothetical protein
VRVYLGGKIIVDSIRSKLVWEVPHYPAYYFPMAEVSMNSLLESDRTERSSKANSEAGVLLQVPMAEELDRLLGQPLRSALRRV